MAIEVTDTFNGAEKQVRIWVQEGDDLVIHPWSATANNRHDSSVYVEVNVRDENSPEHDLMTNGIYDREEFVEAILAVFPELQRA